MTDKRFRDLMLFRPFACPRASFWRMRGSVRSNETTALLASLLSRQENCRPIQTRYQSGRLRRLPRVKTLSAPVRAKTSLERSSNSYSRTRILGEGDDGAEQLCQPESQ